MSEVEVTPLTLASLVNVARAHVNPYNAFNRHLTLHFGRLLNVRLDEPAVVELGRLSRLSAATEPAPSPKTVITRRIVYHSSPN